MEDLGPQVVRGDERLALLPEAFDELGRLGERDGDAVGSWIGAGAEAEATGGGGLGLG